MQWEDIQSELCFTEILYDEVIPLTPPVKNTTLFNFFQELDRIDIFNEETIQRQFLIKNNDININRLFEMYNMQKNLIRNKIKRRRQKRSNLFVEEITKRQSLYEEEENISQQLKIIIEEERKRIEYKSTENILAEAIYYSYDIRLEPYLKIYENINKEENYIRYKYYVEFFDKFVNLVNKNNFNMIVNPDCSCTHIIFISHYLQELFCSTKQEFYKYKSIYYEVFLNEERYSILSNVESKKRQYIYKEEEEIRKTYTLTTI